MAGYRSDEFHGLHERHKIRMSGGRSFYDLHAHARGSVSHMRHRLAFLSSIHDTNLFNHSSRVPFTIVVLAIFLILVHVSISKC